MDLPNHPIIEKMESDGFLQEYVDPVLYCDDCNEGIYAGDIYYKIGAEKFVYCQYCIENYKENA